jgi:hypothetical protein
MPWQKFEALYESHSKRQAVEGVTLVRNAQISGIWANTNYDPQQEGQDPRGELLKEVYANYIKSVKMIYNQFEERDSDQIDWDDPFFKAMKVPSNPYYNRDTDSITRPLPHDHNLDQT